MSTHETGPVTFVNTFTLNAAPAEFEKAFAETAEFLKQQPGLIDFTLLQDEHHDNVYVNIARWESTEALHKAVRHPLFAGHATELRKVSKSEPNFYRPRQSFTAGA